MEFRDLPGLASALRMPAGRSFHRIAPLCAAALLAAATLHGPARADSGYPQLGAVAQTTLPNGLQVVVAPAGAIDLETIDVWVGAGTRRETAENNGAAHFMEHLLFKGTPTRKPGDIDGAIEDLGGTLNAATSYDWAHFYVTVAASDTKPALDILADAVQHAELRQDDMDNERGVILNEMARQQSDPLQQIAGIYNRLEFPDHPYGRPLLGTESNIANMKRQTVLDFYHAYYVPSNVTVVLSGSLPPDQATAMAAKDFGGWSSRPLPSDAVLAEPRQTEIRTQSVTAPVNRGYLIVGFHAPSVRNVPDAYAMDVLLTMLGQGGNNRLEEQLLRKDHVVDSISTNYLTQEDPGTLTISAVYDPSNQDRVLDEILGQIRELRDKPVSDGELAAAKHTLLASYLFDVQTASGRANALGFYNTIDTYRYDTEYISHFESVTADQVQDVARKYLDPTVYTLVTMSPQHDPVTASIREPGNGPATASIREPGNGPVTASTREPGHDSTAARGAQTDLVSAAIR